MEGYDMLNFGRIREAIAVTAAAVIVSALAAPAGAAVTTTTIQNTGFPQSWETVWSGSIDGQSLSATGAWTLTGVASDVWSFTLNLVHNSAAPIGPTTFDPARIVAWGFDSNPGITNFNTSTAGWTAGGNQAQGDFDVVNCVWAGQNCQGGSNAGLEAPGSQLFNFTFVSAASSIVLDNFQIRLQSVGINSAESISLNAIPLPAGAWLILAALGGLGVVARRRKALPA
jgi:hypothetical protein